MRAYANLLITTLYVFYMYSFEISIFCGDNDDCIPKIWTPIFNYMSSHKLEGGIIGSIIYLILIGIIDRKSYNRKRRLIKKILLDFIKSDSGGHNGNHRVTIYVKRKGFVFLPKFLFYTFTRMRYHINNKCLIYRLSCFPVPWMDYLEIFTRVGQPNTKIRDTFFIVPTSKDKINGFVPYVYYNGKGETVVLPQLDKKTLAKTRKIEDITDVEIRKNVKTYLTKSHINNYHKLRTFQRISECIAAYPLFIDDQNLELPSHVLVFDGVGIDEKKFKSITFEKKVIFLSKNIETIISNY
ncbi:hypothetical protein [Marinoscillum luteum]|uniref:SMODS-associated NUDIX domain-containing protein n=1 Tax=Marinoscillum luteum TaxID=861051 RepID=A0ABW7N6P9_9BACT